MDELLKAVGISDYDELNAVEQETYRQMLDQVQNSQITLEDYKKYIKAMRQSLEVSVIEEAEYIHSPILPFLKRKNPKAEQLKGRLKNYLLLEAFFDRPEKAQEMLEMYKKRAKK